MQQHKTRCAWVTNNPVYINYHDQEWGVPLYHEQKLFEFLILEGMQAGLSWITILKKRDNFRLHFDNFNPEKIATYNQHKIEALLKEPGIIRNRLKIQSAITNAKAYLAVQDKFGSFSDYIWDFVEHTPIQNSWKHINEISASTALSEKISKNLKQQGFKFVGKTICYAFMQAVGMVNDHTVDCYCYR